MKKLRRRLERRLCDIFSRVALYCEGKGYFKVSNIYRFPASDVFYLDITKLGEYYYSIDLREDGNKIARADLEYDIFNTSVSIEKAYEVKHFIILEKYSSVIPLKDLVRRFLNEKA